MGLASALSTALTGLTAAETTIDVVGNNLANSNTVGFKSSTANFATQFLQTRSLGSAPTSGSGGSNPKQIGLGTMVADITPNFNQGTIEISSNAMDMAIQGEGFYIVEGSSGEQLYTRNGVFKLNAQDEITTITGNRVLGYTINDQFQIQTTTLEPLTIPLGSKQVSKATENVTLEGTLSPTGDLATKAEIIQTGVLGDAQYSRPTTSGDRPAASLAPDVDGEGTHGTSTGGGTMAEGTYYYKIVYADGILGSETATESLVSEAFSASVGSGDNAIDLSAIPTDGADYYKTRRIYRTEVGATENDTYYLVDEIPNNVDSTYPDIMNDSTLVNQPALNTDKLNNNYTYYVTWVNNAGVESRPSPAIGPIIINNGRIQLRNLPAAAASEDWTDIRIYRNTASYPSKFFQVAELDNMAKTAGLNYTDSASDASIEGNQELNFDGPPILASTLLTNVISRDGSAYQQLFTEGTLSFAGDKGGRTLAAKEYTITDTSTVLDLMEFMEEALGIQEPPGSDPANPIPNSQTATGTVEPGAEVLVTGQIRIVGNNGTANAIDINLGDLRLTEAATGTQDNVNLPFSSTQAAVGESAVADFVAYDSLGIAVNVRLTTVMESRNGTSTTYRWFADSPDNQESTGVSIAVGTGLITFDGEGNFSTSTENMVSIERRDTASTSPLQFAMDFSQLSGLAVDSSTLAVSRQDGSAPGVLTSFIVGEDGTIRGVFSNGITRDLGQIRLARFGNPAGLEQKGENLYSTGVNSGLPVEGNPGEQGIGEIIAGATELSNTDIGSNLIDLILASTMYRGNTRVVTTSQEMLDELLALRR